MHDDETQYLADRPDGFRPRKKRPKGWLARAIEDGSVRDPALGPLPDQEHAPDAHVIAPPAMTARGGKE